MKRSNASGIHSHGLAAELHTILFKVSISSEKHTICPSRNSSLRLTTNCAALKEIFSPGLINQALDVEKPDEVFDGRSQIHTALLTQHP